MLSYGLLIFYVVMHGYAKMDTSTDAIVHHLEREIETLKAKLSGFDVKTEIQQLREKISSLERTVTLQQKKIQSLTHYLPAKDDNLSFYGSDAANSSDRDPSSSQGQRYVNKRLLMTGRPSGGVAFSAVLTKVVYHIGLGQTMKFDNVLLNEGSGYNPHSGMFSAPTAGVYLFVYYIAHEDRVGQAWIQLMKNGVRQNAAVSDVEHVYMDLQGGNAAIIRLDAGEDVWLESFHQADTSIEGRSGFSSFSGALLYH